MNTAHQILKLYLWSIHFNEEFADEILDIVDQECDFPRKVTKYGCFTKNTPIKTKDGKKKISVLVPGDSIYSYNQKLNITELKPMTGIKNYVVAAILALAISNDDTLSATVDHPFFINGKYVAAQELHPGDQFSTYDGSNLFLKEKHSKDTTIQVYNLTVADNVNYYVGRNPVLAHNSCFLNHLDHYPILKATVNDLDEGLKGEFIKDFFKAGNDVLDQLNKSPGMVKAWKGTKNSIDVGIAVKATDILFLQEFAEIVQNNNLSPDADGLQRILNAAAQKGQLWEFPENILDAVKRASNAKIAGLKINHKKFTVRFSNPYVLGNAKQYQYESILDANLSFELNGVSFDDVKDGFLIDRKFGHNSVIWDEDGGIINEIRIQSLVDQAERQLSAAKGIQIRWEISTPVGAKNLNQYFLDNGVNIKVVHIAQVRIL